MKKVKITILKTTLDKELAVEYGIDGLTACPMMKATATGSRSPASQSRAATTDSAPSS